MLMPKSQQPLPDDAPDADVESVVRNLVLRRLTQRAYTRYQLEEYLQRKGADVDVVAKVLDRFEEVRLVNDREFAAEFIRARRSIKGTGPAVLRLELKKRGISDDVIAAELDLRVGDDVDVARDIAQRKLASLSRFDADTQNRRLVSFLVRRGYSAHIAYGVARELVPAFRAEH